MTIIGLMTQSLSTMGTFRLHINQLRRNCNHHHHQPHLPHHPHPGDQQVTILNESHFPDWNINEFRMMRGDTVSLINYYHCHDVNVDDDDVSHEEIIMSHDQVPG